MATRRRTLLAILAVLGGLVIVVRALEIDTSGWFHGGGSASRASSASTDGRGAAAGIWSAPRAPHGQQISSGTDWYVNAATGNDTNDCLTQATPCLTINAAIGKASAPDSIHVAAGTYNEHVQIPNSPWINW